MLIVVLLPSVERVVECIFWLGGGDLAADLSAVGQAGVNWTMLNANDNNIVGFVGINLPT